MNIKAEIPEALVRWLKKAGETGVDVGKYAGRMGGSALEKGADLAREYPAGAAGLGGLGVGLALGGGGQDEAEMEVLRRYLQQTGAL